MGLKDFEFGSPNPEATPQKAPELSFGKPDTTWQKYNLNEVPIRYNNYPSGYKAVIRKGQLISIVGSQYELLPNEEAVKVADQAAEMVGLVPFHEFTGDWFVRMYKHVIYNRKQTQVHALYAINKPYYVNDEKMHVGVGVHIATFSSLPQLAKKVSLLNHCCY